MSICTILMAVIVGQSSPAEQAIEAMSVPEGMSREIYAAEPMIADPVAFCFDELGNIFVAEIGRIDAGVEDNRDSPFWLLDDLASQTVDDRRAMYTKWAERFEGGEAYFSSGSDQIRMLQDVDGDGRADRSTIYATGFNAPLDGLGAGVLARDGAVWYTNIPHLWKLQDLDGDGVADERTAVHSGFGVRTALMGHDMHGLTWGPEGRLYWSIGDRGYHVQTHEGEILHSPNTGAVLRCWPDGSGLEVYHHGLRNPQELAFDDHGNLFTGDNTSDGGDRARLVYCVEGGETGWDMDYQTLDGENLRGPWMQEEIWRTQREGQPAWTLPPIAHIGAGPSGFTHYPGTGLPPAYDDHLFMCDFTGGSASSTVWSIDVEEDGAGFSLIAAEPFIRGVLCTDFDFGYDGRMYVADWGAGWKNNGEGRLFAIWDDAALALPDTQSVAAIFRTGFEALESDDLGDLLFHSDQRVRQGAQFELAARGGDGQAILEAVVRQRDDLTARLHGIWGLRTIANGYTGSPRRHPLRRVVPLLRDEEPEVRAQAARMLGDTRYQPATAAIRSAILDPAPRVRFFAAIAAGRLADGEAMESLVTLLIQNADEDRFLRHGGVMGLTGIGDPAAITLLLSHDDPSVRMAALLALRRLERPEIAAALLDGDSAIVIEAARAIQDVPIDAAMGKLADRLEQFQATRRTEASQNTCLWEIFDESSGGTPDLGNDASFQGPATASLTLSSMASQPQYGDHYRSRLTTTFTPTQSGPHTFFLSSDDQSVLLFQEVDSDLPPAKIASIDGWVAPGTWDQLPTQVSSPIHLNAGIAYLLEARHREGTGEDHLLVGVKYPDGVLERPIGGSPSSGTAPLIRRAIDAAVRRGTRRDLIGVAAAAASEDVDAILRRDAVAALGDWIEPPIRDRVHGRIRPMPSQRHVSEGDQEALQAALMSLAQGSNRGIANAAVAAMDRSGLTISKSLSQEWLSDSERSPSQRRAALGVLLSAEPETRRKAIDVATSSGVVELQTAAAIAQAQDGDHVPAAAAMRDLVSTGSVSDRQHAIGALSRLPLGASEPSGQWLVEHVEGGSLDPSVLLDVIEWMDTQEVSDSAGHHLVDDAMRHAALLEGGDPLRGGILFRSHPQATCLRCHTSGGHGGNAGPTLDDVGLRLTPRELVESILDPQAMVVDEYGPISAMPVMTSILTPREIRDLVAYLHSLK
jgi:putative membrane-bound dehydrogenase-like protein